VAYCQYDGADGLWWFLTGAYSYGGSQPYAISSLGYYMSETRLVCLGIVVTGGPANLRIDFASAENEPGTGMVRVTGASAVAYTPPGGSEGPAVTIANGQTKVVPGDNEDKCVTVTRTDAVALSIGETMALTLTDTYNNMWDIAHDAERAAGDTEIRCFAFINKTAFAIENIKIWLRGLADTAEVDAAGYAAAGAVAITAKAAGGFGDWPQHQFVINATTGEVMRYEKTSSSELAVSAAERDVWGEGTAAAGVADDVLHCVSPYRIGAEAPTDLAFSSRVSAGEGAAVPVTTYHPLSASDANVVSVGSLSAGGRRGLWLERLIVDGQDADPRVEGLLSVQFETA